MSADELIFEVIDVASGSDHKICPHALGASAVELYAVYSADIIDVDGVSILNGQGRISGIGDIRSVICCTSGIRAARCGSVVRTAAAAVRTRVGIDDQDNNKNDDDKDRMPIARALLSFRRNSFFRLSSARLCWAIFLFSFFIVHITPF